MPLRVVHPVRLVVDRSEVGNEAQLADALETALTSAVAASVEQVLSGRTPGTGVRIMPPRVSWAPSPAPALEERERDRLTGWIGAAVANALAASGVRDGILAEDGTVGEPDAEAGLSGGGARTGRGEPVDETRIHRPLRRYVVPSYGGKRTAAARLILPAGGEGIEVTYEPSGRDWTPIDRRNIARVYRMELSRRHYPEPASGLLGVIFRSRRTGLLHIAAVSYPDGHLVPDFALDYISESYVDAKGNVAFRPTALSADSAYTLSWEGSVAQTRGVMTRFYKQDLDGLLRDNVEPGALQDKASYDAAIQERVNATIEDQVETVHPEVTCFVRLGVNGVGFLIALKRTPDWVREGLSIELIPLTEQAAPTGTPADTAEQGAGERGRGRETTGGRAGTPGEGAESGGEQGAPWTDGPSGTLPWTEGDAISLVETDSGEPTKGVVYPQSAAWSLVPLTQDCTAFEGEPSVEELGEAGAGLRSLMARIAALLQMRPCEHIGAFLLDCGRYLGARAHQVANADDHSTGRPQTPAAGVRGNLGDLHFVPTASVSIQLMRQLASTVPLISRLSRDYRAALAARPDLIQGSMSGRFDAWRADFLAELTPAVAQGVGQVFAMTSSVLFGQVLRTSATVIERALSHLPQTANVFAERVLPMLIGVEQYTTWRDRLQEAIDEDLRRRVQAARFGVEQPAPVAPEYAVPPAPAPTGAGAGGDIAAAREAWRQSASGTVAALAGQGAAHGAAGGAAVSERAGEVVHTPTGYRLLDNTGRPRTVEELEQLIILARGAAESVDPLVKHIDDLPESVSRMREGPDAVERELRSILERMALSNKWITMQADGDVTYGFTATSIQKDIEHATVPGSTYSLAGIHHLAHTELAEFFAGDRFYALGIDALMDSELGRKALVGQLEMVGLVLISVLCPPAGIVLGIELAAYHLAEAYERKMVYQALVDPDVVLSRAEVELGLFAAWFGMVVSLLPVLGKLAGAFKTAAPLAGAAEGELSASARMAASSAGEEAAAVVGQVERDLVGQFIRDLMINEALSEAIGVALGPVFAHLQHRLETSAAVGGLDRALAMVLARRAAAGSATSTPPAHPPKEPPR